MVGCNMTNFWRKLERVKYADKCLDCKRLIKAGQSAWWLKGYGILHDDCGLGSKRFVLSPVYTDNPTYDGNPFKNINKHLPVFYDAKEFRESQK